MTENREGSPLILIVEDNRDSRELLVKVLSARGYRIAEAVDGEEALQQIAAERPALVLMDISIPKIDGLEVTRIVKGQEHLKDIPIIALTAHAMKGDREKAMQAGCDGYIPKPINVRELPEQIKAFMKNG
ncbi:MAG: two-component system response regulator [Deltaproteobacteria bacterium RIFOXYD12_FULL_57_12]|nr:MAG: two-component system response regulator [Deltaproteobacteria bacterium RIFOXYD12_FULL_57_12]